MGTVTILPETTKDPISLIGRRAGICYGTDISDPIKNYKRGMDCIKKGHGRTMDFPEVHMHIKGYSAKVIREYYTHIGCLPARLQESTRYINYAKDGFEYITPHTVERNKEAKAKWDWLMDVINSTIVDLNKNYNIPIEDASETLPLCMETGMVDKRDLRNLVDMSRNRECNRAYWEFRELFRDIKNALSDYSEEWEILVSLLFYPKCKELGYCSEKKPCPRNPKKDDGNK